MQIEPIPFCLDRLRDPTLFNSANHWDPADQPPSDYDAKMKATDTTHWLDAFRTDYVKIAIEDADVATLRKIRTLYLFRERISDIFADDLATLTIKYDARLPRQGGPYFVRASNVSLKYGIHKNRPHSTFRTIFESLVTCPPNHSPLLFDESPLALYLIPWVQLEPDLEWRVFVCQGRITAISQQNIYRRNEIITAKNAAQYTKTIVDYFDTHIQPRISPLLHSYCFDIGFDVVNQKLYFIEINPFGQEYSSGSALFHWIRDASILYGTISQNSLVVRFTA